MNEWLKKHVYDMAAYGGLLVCLILFLIFSGEKLGYNMGVVLQTAAPYAVIALGAVFVYAMGYMDVSVGQQIGVYCIMMILISQAMGGSPLSVVVGFAAILAIALACGALNGAVSVWLGLPSIVTSLFLMFVFGGAQLLLMEKTGTNSISMPIALKPMDRTTYNLMLAGVILVVTLAVTYFFNYTKLGKYTKSIGANEVATAQSGVNTLKWKVFAYMGFAACLAVGTYLLLARTGSAGKGTGTGYAMDVMICLILGGMPLAGGMRSKVSSALIGTFTYVLLTNDLTTMGVGINMLNLVKSIIFIAIILLTCRKWQGNLPR